MTRPIGAPAVVTLRVLEALGWERDPDRAAAFLAQAAARQLPRLSVSDLREVLAAVVAASPQLPAQRPGSHVYEREQQPDPGDGGRRHRGPGIGGVVDDSGQVVPE